MLLCLLLQMGQSQGRLPPFPLADVVATAQRAAYATQPPLQRTYSKTLYLEASRLRGLLQSSPRGQLLLISHCSATLSIA